ncbi:MAG: hypothetical protein ACRDBQ_18625 [Shewanella sp.]
MKDKTDLNSDPGYDPNTDINFDDENPSSAEGVPGLTDWVNRRESKSNPGPVNTFNDSLSVWQDRLRLTFSLGLKEQALTNPLMGFNHMMANNPIPVNREYGALTFFTRTDMNLCYDNLSASRRFSNMAMQPKSSLDYAILASLDPDFELGFDDSPLLGNGQRKNRLGTPFNPEIPFDNLQAFIPLLSSQLMSLSGAQDESIDFWFSEEGLMREQWGMADSTNLVNNNFGVSSTFTNPYGNMIMKTMSVWLEWMAGVKAGIFKPKIRNSIQRRVDYQSRIYGLKYDPLGNIVRFWTVCIAMPTNNNAGTMAQVDNTKPMSADDSNVSIQWQAIGCRYDDPTYMDAFNKTVGMFNPDMLPHPSSFETGRFVPYGRDKLVQIIPEFLPLFNYYGYPHIDSIRRKITWWVYQADYQRILKKAGII